MVQRSGIADDRAPAGGGLDFFAELGAPDDIYRFWILGEPYPRVIIDPDAGGAGGVLTGNGLTAPSIISGGGSVVSTVAGRIGDVVLGQADITGLVAALLTLTNGLSTANTAITARALAARLVSAGAGLVGGGSLVTDRTISMPNVGTAGDYGDANHATELTVDAQGRVTGVTLHPIITSSPIPFSKGGFITGGGLAGGGDLHGGWLLTAALNLTRVKVGVKIAPIGRDMIFDVLRAPAGTDPALATTIFTTTANRPTIVDGTWAGTSGVPDITAFAEDDWVIPICVQSGSPGTEGSDLIMLVETAP